MVFIFAPIWSFVFLSQNVHGFSALFDLSSLHGHNGFSVNGVGISDFSGTSVSSAGDFNGDGIDDMIIGANGDDPYGNVGAGAAFIMFGSSEIGTSAALNGSFDLSGLTGSNGFVLNGIDAGDATGFSVSSAGDFNNDGLSDVIIGAWYSDPNDSVNAGESYIVFGSPTVGGSGLFNLSSVNGTNGFVINGDAAGDFSGNSVSGAGDVNGDGYDDVVIGAKGAAPDAKLFAGSAYIVFGGVNVGNSGSFNLADVDGSNGLKLKGIASFDQCGTSVSGVGDFNNDGYDDVIVGASSASPASGASAGESYIVHGSATMGSSGVFEMSALDGSNGFVINGAAASDYSGFSVSSAGDFNGDGYDDVVIGAYGAEPNDSGSGASYIVFGGSSVGASGSMELSDLSGADGFVMNGLSKDDKSGYSVATTGDFNNDGYDDVIVGAYSADPRLKSNAGESYIVFGGPNVGSSGTMELSALDGTDGFIVNGAVFGDRSGWAVNSAGDVNDDGYVDVMIGAYYADPNGISKAGETFVLFGNGVFTDSPTFFPTWSPTHLPTAVPTGPTPLPSTPPSHDPTHLPTLEPTPRPTMVPRPDPTIVPVPAPSLKPSPPPSSVPALHPTPSPSFLPSPHPVSDPTSVPIPAPSLHPTDSPSLVPSPAPTLTPTLFPTTFDTATVAIEFAVGASGVASLADEVALKEVVANTTETALTAIKSFQLDSLLARRLNEAPADLRELTSYTWYVNLDIQADLSVVGEATPTSFASSLYSSLTSAAFTQSLIDHVPTSVTWVNDVLSTAITHSPTHSPTQVPMPAPTQSPILPSGKKKRAPSSASSYLFLLLVFPVVLVGFYVYKHKTRVMYFFYSIKFLNPGYANTVHDDNDHDHKETEAPETESALTEMIETSQNIERSQSMRNDQL